jgi:hypothetical protein
MQETEALFFRFNAIFLWRYQVKQCFGTAIQLMEFTVTGLAVVLPTTLMENGKKEGAVMEGAVFDGIV